MGLSCILFSLLWSCYITSTGYAFTINISPDGKDEPICKDISVKDRPPCATIDFVLDGGKGITNNTVILIEPGHYSLANDTHFENIYNVSIIGNKLNGTAHNISCSKPNIGVGFLRCGNVSIRGLHFENCGKKRDAKTRNIEEITSFLHFVFSKDVELSNLELTKGKGAGITIIDTGGLVALNKVTVTKNRFNGAGSGILIATTRCGALDTVNCTFQHEQQKYIHKGTFQLTSVTLDGNENDNRNELLSEEMKSSTPKLGQAGGLTIHLCGNSSENNFSLIWCSFYNNKAKWGGGLYIGIKNTSQSNIITGSNLAFYNNQAVYGGGAMQVTLLHAKNLRLSKDNIIEFSNSYFGFNKAIWGGAVSIKGSTRILVDGTSDAAPVAFKSVKFFSNAATVGSAVAAATNNMNHNPIGPGVSDALLLEDCRFNRNEIIKTEDKKVVGQGAVYAEEFLLLVNSTDFIKNSGTALVLDSSSFKVIMNVTFDGNSGEKGGAIALYGNSWICLTAKSILLFSKNSAIIKGGAVYFKFSGAQRVGFQTTKLATKDCFFRYEHQDALDPSKWDCKVIFIDNMAPDASGNSIFASSLQTCRQKNEQRMTNSALEWPKVFIYISTFNRSYPEIATETINITTDPRHWNVLPSVPFTPRIELIDEKGHSVYGTVKVNIKSINNSTIRLDPPNNVFLIKDEIHGMKIIGKKGSDFNVDLMTTDGQLTRTTPVKVQMKNCPPGFYQAEGTTSCECMEAEKAITRCGENFTAFLLAGYWGHVSKKNNKFEAFKCPKHYCDCSRRSGRDYYECPYDAITCGQNRAGVLCGECKAGYSVLLGTERCEKCTNYYLFLLIPILIVATGFVLVVFYFNFDAFSGYLNAFLYSYQSIDTVLPEIIELDPFISVVIGILCLSGTGNTVGLCLFHGFTDLHKLGFNLAVPIYILLFTVFIGVCLSAKLFSRFSGNAIRYNSLGRALSFVYTYCYTALTSKALVLLNPVKIDNAWMLYSAPSVPFFGKEHVGYAIAAIMVLIIFTLGFPVLLMFTPYFTKHFQSISRMEPAFNALKLCFKNPVNSKTGSDYGRFAAFYFFCRLVLLLFDVFVKDVTPRLVLIAIASVFFQVFFSWFQPYVIWTMNFWDVVMLTNMCVISIVSIIVSVPYMLDKIYIDLLTVLLKILAYVPLLVIVIRFFAYKKSIRDRKRRSQSIEGMFLTIYFHEFFIIQSCLLSCCLLELATKNVTHGSIVVLFVFGIFLRSKSEHLLLRSISIERLSSP